LAKVDNSGTADTEQPNKEGATVSETSTNNETPAKTKRAKAKTKKAAKPTKAKKTKKTKAAATAKPRKAKGPKANGIVAEFHMHAEGPRADMLNVLAKPLGKLHTSDALAKHFDDDKARVSHVMAMLQKKATRYRLPYKVVKEEGKYGLSAK
jgi:hypothetical protein